MPRSRNTRIRPKNTSRVEARRRHRDEQREAEADAANDGEVVAEGAEEQPQRSAFAFKMPNVLDDIKALPRVFLSKWMWVPFLMLLVTFGAAVALINGVLDDLPDPVREGLTLYVSLTLHPTTLFIFFIGGLVAPRASYLIGAILGALSSTIYLVVLAMASEVARETNLEAITSTTGGEIPGVTMDLALQTYGLGIAFGVVAGGFAAWYRRFLRNSQERARLNRMHKEQEQAQKAKEQARADKQAVRDSRRRS